MKMFNYLDTLKIKWADWFIKRAYSTHFKYWLAAISFSESILFPFPTVVFLILILVAESKKWIYYAGFTTIFSVLGGIAGYIIAAFFFDTVGIKIINFYNLNEEIEYVKVLFEGNAFLVNFIGAFTPIPYKVFVLSSGFLKINFIAFITASILGRSLQFFSIAYLTKVFGSTFSKLLFKYFKIFVFIILIVIILSFLI